MAGHLFIHSPIYDLSPHHFPLPTLILLSPGFDLALWPKWRNTPWIDIQVRLAVTLLDMLEVRRGLDARYVPMEILQPTIERWLIVSYTL